MCLAIPAKVVELHGDGSGVIDVGGLRKTVSLMLVDDVEIGDFVILHVGYAIAKLDEAEAAKTLALFAEIASHIGEHELSKALGG